MKLYAVADLAAGSWTPSTGATLYGCIDEASLNRGDYIILSPFAPNTPCQVRLTDTTGTSSAVAFQVDYQINSWQEGGGDPSKLVVKIYEGANLVATRSLNPTDSNPHTAVINLDAGELALWNAGNTHSVTFERAGVVLFGDYYLNWLEGDATIAAAGRPSTLPCAGA